MRRYDNGDRPRRDTDDGRGRWKVSTGKQDKEEKKVAGDGTTHYCMSVLNYFESPRGEGRKSEWLMRELTIPAYEIKLPKDGGPGGKTVSFPRFQTTLPFPSVFFSVFFAKSVG